MPITISPIKGRVGRHVHAHGRQCQNWPADQQYVTGLLNRIPSSEGGSQGTLNGRTISGVSSEALYGAILVFEEKHFPGRRRGFVDPNGAVIRKLEELAFRTNGSKAKTAPTGTPSAPSSLQRLQHSLLDDAEATRVDPFFPMLKPHIQPLVAMAYKHISNLIEMGRTDLPGKVELFGRAHVLSDDLFIHNLDFSLSHLVLKRDPKLSIGLGDNETTLPPLPEMRFGFPVTPKSNVWTTNLSAVLLFKNGLVIRMGPYRRAVIQLLENYGPEGLKFNSEDYRQMVELWAAA